MPPLPPKDEDQTQSSDKEPKPAGDSLDDMKEWTGPDEMRLIRDCMEIGDCTEIAEDFRYEKRLRANDLEDCMIEWKPDEGPLHQYPNGYWDEGNGNVVFVRPKDRRDEKVIKSNEGHWIDTPLST